MAFEMAKLVRVINTAPEYQKPIADPTVMRAEAAGTDGRVTLRSLLKWCWEHGIPVVPLLGGRGFSAAVWAIDNSPVIVLKEPRASAVYWLFDLAHELGHIALGHITDDGIVDIDQIGPHPDGGDDDEEQMATRFALDLLLPDYELLLRKIRIESRGSYLRFKSAVEGIAHQARVSPGLVGMVAAYQLTDIGDDKDRWGSATNLAKPDGDGRPTTEEIAHQYLRIDETRPVDAALLRAAVFSD